MCKTSKNLKNGHCPFKAAIADAMSESVKGEHILFITVNPTHQ